MNSRTALLLEMLESGDDDLRREGSMLAAIVLEEDAASSDPDNSNDETGDLIQNLTRLIKTDMFLPDMLWALGKANKNPAALESLLLFLNTESERLDDESCYQLLIAIENFPYDWMMFLADSGSVGLDAIDANARAAIQKLVNTRAGDRTGVVAERILRRRW